MFKPGIEALFVINRKIANTAIGRDVAGALADFGFPVCPAALHQRVVYAESAAQGLAVIEAAPGGEAAAETRALAQAILGKRREAAAGPFDPWNSANRPAQPGRWHPPRL